jgi:hypothetical protein
MFVPFAGARVSHILCTAKESSGQRASGKRAVGGVSFDRASGRHSHAGAGAKCHLRGEIQSLAY